MFSIVTTIKNRKDHFQKTFTSLVTQETQIPYEIVIVDFASNDGFSDICSNHIESLRPLFSDSLTNIKRVNLEFDAPFNSGKAKNLAYNFLDDKSDIMSFTDIDVFLGMNYHQFWLDKIDDKSFFSSRIQETTEHNSRRINPKINYGNMIVSKQAFGLIGGFDENNPTWGGDDDDITHRLKLTGLRELNPYNKFDAHHTSIMHGDDLRLSNLEDDHKSQEHALNKFKRIRENKVIFNDNFLNFHKKNKDLIKCEVIYGT